MDKKKFCEMTNRLRLLYDRYEEVTEFLFKHGIRMDDDLFYGVNYGIYRKVKRLF